MIFDGHSDLWVDVMKLQKSYGKGNVLNDYYADQLIDNGVTGSIFVFWVEPQYDDDPAKRIGELMTMAKKEIDASQDKIKLILGPNDLVDTNKFQLMLGMEGLGHIGDDYSKIKEYYDYGIRHASLTWNDENLLATGVLGNPLNGLKQAGYKVIEEMEKHKMIVDVSHLNEKSFWDIVNVTKRPVIASHSNARSLADNPRNLTDDQLKAVAKSGGLIGLNTFKQFVSDQKEQQTIDGLMKHAEHIINLVGIEHLVIGFDYCDYVEGDDLSTFSEDSVNPGVEGLNTLTDTKNIIPALKGIGLSDEEIELVKHRNYMNFLSRVL